MGDLRSSRASALDGIPGKTSNFPELDLQDGEVHGVVETRTRLWVLVIVSSKLGMLKMRMRAHRTLSLMKLLSPFINYHFSYRTGA